MSLEHMPTNDKKIDATKWSQKREQKSNEAQQLQQLERSAGAMSGKNEILRTHINEIVKLGDELKAAHIDTENLEAPLHGSYDPKLVALSQKFLEALDKAEAIEKEIYDMAKSHEALFKALPEDLRTAPLVKTKLGQAEEHARALAHNQIARLVSEKIYTNTYRSKKAEAEKMIMDNLKVTGETQGSIGGEAVFRDDEVDSFLGAFGEEPAAAGAEVDIDVNDLLPPPTESIGKYTGAGDPEVVTPLRTSIPRARPPVTRKKNEDQPGYLKYGAL